MEEEKVRGFIRPDRFDHRGVRGINELVAQGPALALELIQFVAPAAGVIIDLAVVSQGFEAVLPARDAVKVLPAPVLCEDARNLRETFVTF